MPTKPPQSDIPNIGAPAMCALTHEGYTTLKQLTKLSEAELAQLHGVGPKAVRILKERLKANGLSFKPAKVGETLKKKGSPISRTDAVDEFLRELCHPLKAEIEAVRVIIKSVHKDINEEVKWKAPSFNYKGEYLVTFNWQLAPVDIGPAPIGHCHTCEAHLEGDARFCDADCRGDWQARQNMKRILGK